ncbi:MAG: AAA family ATPase [Candidatus Omnitrophica bacterium]|nr:AAA family ATPase [Candidatus Omnitrophota bacterium]
MEDFTMRDYVKVLFRQKWVIIVTFVTVMVTVSIGLLLRTPVYEATVKMLITGEKQAASPYYRELVSYQNIGAAITQSEIVKANPVVELVIRTIGIKPLDYESRFANPVKRLIVKFRTWQIEKRLADPKITEEQRKSYYYRSAIEDLKDSVKVEPMRDTNLFTITVKDYNPMAAAALANILSRAYAIFDLQQQLAEMQIKYGDKNLAVTQLRDSINKLTKNLTGQPLPDVEAIGPASVKIIEQAQPPLKPSGMPDSLTFILALFMALFLGVMLAFAFEYMDQTFKAPSDVTRSLGIPYLGSIPRKFKQDSFKDVADQIYFEVKDNKLKTLLFTAALPEEGVTTVVNGIAAQMAAKAHYRVLMIDANPVNASLHKALNIPNKEGLFEVLEGKVPLERAIVTVGPHLNALTAGKTLLNPATLLESNKMADMIKQVAGKYDAVLIDCANLMESKDVLSLIAHTDGVVLLVNESKTRKQVAKAAIVPLEQKKARIVGAILGNRTFAIPRAIYERV